jgi:hypothetical protein
LSPQPPVIRRFMIELDPSIMSTRAASSTLCEHHVCPNKTLVQPVYKQHCLASKAEASKHARGPMHYSLGAGSCQSGWYARACTSPPAPVHPQPDLQHMTEVNHSITQGHHNCFMDTTHMLPYEAGMESTAVAKAAPRHKDRLSCGSVPSHMPYW